MIFQLPKTVTLRQFRQPSAGVGRRVDLQSEGEESGFEKGTESECQVDSRTLVVRQSPVH